MGVRYSITETLTHVYKAGNVFSFIFSAVCTLKPRWVLKYFEVLTGFCGLREGGSCCWHCMCAVLTAHHCFFFQVTPVKY